MDKMAYYPVNYHVARTQFRALAVSKKWELHSLAVDESDGLYIDVALWRGSSESLMIHSSGVHGVEAFPGSAVQCAFLSSWEPGSANSPSIALIHCINPFGMRYLRRWNAQNIDLNRNFLPSFDNLPTNPFYDRLSSFLNPQSRNQLSYFTLKAVVLLMKHGLASLQQAVAQGQYNNPVGLFFGGKQPVIENSLLRHFLQQYLSEYKIIRGIDFHTGLGKFNQSSFYLEALFGQETHQQAESIFNQPVIRTDAQTKHSYQMQGSLVAGLRAQYAEQDFWMVTQEVGTVGPVEILRVLRKENFNFHYQSEDQAGARLAVKDAFCPDNNIWRKQAVQSGVQALTQLVKTHSSH
ncbi:DUF2817 domain-containing protein [Tunicatimonas pelagia]|uniref:DUF2817 domain-containing protein n=1 Tax=Tunicatimonas pelagia TaxID=931531 RepID=UPI0026663D82|nr:DUF2817 domain-containing protein [Tunicatimonas pelagia]WKN42001.1 DUF2817 domain-containing protein [Tunicatimonas pelagia]